jgi:hypothetical protein
MRWKHESPQDCPDSVMKYDYQGPPAQANTVSWAECPGHDTIDSIIVPDLTHALSATVLTEEHIRGAIAYLIGPDAPADESNKEE